MTKFFTKIASVVTTLALVAAFAPFTAIAAVPVAVNDAYDADQDTQLSVSAPGVLANDTIATSSMVASLVSPAANGSVNLNADGSFTYDPNPGFSGVDSFVYQAEDSATSTDSAQATVEITVNAAPVVADTTINFSGGTISQLQAEIDGADAGDIIVVTGNYSGDLTISTGITLKSSGGPETASINNGHITISTDGATLEGFTIKNPNGSFGVVIDGVSNVQVIGNSISEIGTSLSSGSAQAVYLSAGSSDVSNITISDNTIDQIGNTGMLHGGGSGSSAKGIYVGDSSGSATVDRVSVTGNQISNVFASTADWVSGGGGGAGAIGIQVNYGVKSTGSVAGLEVSDNQISTLEGLWARGIGLETNTPNAVMSGNSISGLTDHKDGLDGHEVFFESNSSKTTVQMDGQTLGSLDRVAISGTWSGYSHNPVVSLNGDHYLYGVNAFTTVEAGVDAVADGGTVNVLPGDYDLVKDDSTPVSGQTGWYLAITKNGITLQGVDSNGNVITDSSETEANIYSTQITANGAWATQNLITVFADDVTVSGLGIMNKISPNKGIEVIGDNFTAKDNHFSPVPVSLFADAADYNGNDLTKYGSGVYFNNNGTSDERMGTITGNLFENSGITFDSFGDNWTVTISENTFDGNKSWTSGGSTTYYAAIGATSWSNPPALDFTGSTININENSFVNMIGGNLLLKVSRDGMVGTFTATENWWGSAEETVIQALVSADHVVYSPWYVDAEMTRLNTDPEPSSGGGGGRSGQSRSTSVNTTTETTTTTTGGDIGDGQVLGAETYNYTTNLTIGSTGADVTALQAMLIASGHLTIAAPTGYFGEMTRAALAKWQAANGVSPASGYFGPITRAAIANMGTPTMTAEARAVLLLSLLEQVAALQAQLNAMNAE